MFWLRNKKVNFSVRTLIWRSDLGLPLPFFVYESRESLSNRIHVISFSLITFAYIFELIRTIMPSTKSFEYLN